MRAVLLLGCHYAHAHPADQSEMRARPQPHRLELRFTFNILTLSKFVRIDRDGDAKISMTELEAAQPRLTEYLNQRIPMEINQQKAVLGEQVSFAYLWPNAGETPPMTEFDYAARNVDVTFTLPVESRLLEDFWIEFDFFEQTGPMQTIRGMYEQDGQVLEVLFTLQEPEYTYDTGFAEDPFVQQAEARKTSVSEPVTWPSWLLIPAFVALTFLYRSTISRRLRTLK